MSTKNPSEQKLVCPKCRSENITVELRSAGTTSKTNYYRTGVKKSWVIPAGQKTYNSDRKYKTVAICQNCGYHWTTSGEGCGCFGTVFIIIALCVLSLIVRGCGASENQSEEQEGQSIGSIWASSYTPLTDFDYYIDDDTLFLREYTGDDSSVYIAPSYTVDGRELPVYSLDGASFFYKVNSIIVSEGICEIDSAAFNGSHVKYLYLPSTLQDFSGWSYFRDVEKIYYGGDKAMWNELFTWSRSSLDVIEVIYNASISDLLSND